MKFTEAPIQGVWVIEPRLFRDERGYFYESFGLKKFEEATGQKPSFVQDNHSLSTYGVLRGLHFQFGDAAQAKLIRVLSGRVLDVVADIRKGSPTYGKTFTTELSAENKKQLFVPRGFAHGFVTLSETCEFTYKCDNFYNASKEGGIRFDDPDLTRDWKIPKEEIKISEKDHELPFLAQTDFEFHEA